MNKIDLIQTIKDNPGCIATVDNDYWALHKPRPKPNSEMTDDDWDDWHENSQIAHSGEIIPLGDGGYGSGNCYGGDLLQALALIVGVKIESV